MALVLVQRDARWIREPCAQPADRFDKGKRPLTGAAPTPLADVGDEAYYVTTPGTGTALNVKSGTVVFQLRVYGFTPDEVRAMEKSLAEAILGKP